jgi:hypothetical protein
MKKKRRTTNKSKWVLPTIKLLLLGSCIALTILAILFVYDIPYVRQTFALANSTKPEPYTELYFEDYLHLPSHITPKQQYFFQFTLHNLENKDMDYSYEVYVEIGQDKFLIDKGAIFVKNNEYKTVQEEFAVASALPRSKIVTEVTNKKLQIAFWVGGTR